MTTGYELKRYDLGCYPRWPNYDFIFKKEKGINNTQTPTAGTWLGIDFSLRVRKLQPRIQVFVSLRCYRQSWFLHAAFKTSKLRVTSSKKTMFGHFRESPVFPLPLPCLLACGWRTGVFLQAIPPCFQLSLGWLLQLYRETCWPAGSSILCKFTP